MACETHVNDTGTTIKITIKDCDGNAVDISGATDIAIIFKKPSGTIVSKTGSLYTNGIDGIVTYVIPSELLNEVGTWKIQASIASNNGSWKSDIESFKVHRNL